MAGLFSTAMLALSMLGPVQHDRAKPDFIVTVDSARREVVIQSGPYALPAMMGEGHHGHHMEGHATPLFGFAWPVTGWLRGFSVAVVDGSGRPLPRELLHHMNLLNLDRRQLLDPAVERVLAAGHETGPVLLPASVAIPLGPGTRLGLMAAWHNPGMETVDDVWLKVTLRWTPANQNPRPIAVLPVAFDADYQVATSDAYDLPAGRSFQSREFIMPIDGHLVIAGGHLHDYGIALRLEEVETGRVILELKADTTDAGTLCEVGRKLPGVRGEGIALRAGRRYRVVGEYNNTSGRLIPEGAMAVIGGLFVPRCMRCWPGIDPGDAAFQRDLATLPGDGWTGEDWVHDASPNRRAASQPSIACLRAAPQ
jgi:hypothetical protein